MRKIYSILLLILALLILYPAIGYNQTQIDYNHYAGSNYKMSSYLGISSYTDTTKSISEVQFKDPAKAVRKSVLHTIAPIGIGSAIVYNDEQFGGSFGEIITRVGVGLMTYGIIVGPAIGQYYAGAEGDGGIKIRILGTALSGGGAAGAAFCSFTVFFGGSQCSATLIAVMYAATIGGTGLTLYSMIKNILTADNVAREHNRSVKEMKNKISVGPYFHPKTESKGLTIRIKL